MAELKKEVPVFKEKTSNKDFQKNKEIHINEPSIHKKVSTISSKKFKSNPTKDNTKKIKKLISKTNTTRSLLILTISATLWLVYQNQLLKKKIAIQSQKIQEQEEKIKELNLFKDKLKSLEQAVSKINNKVDSQVTKKNPIKDYFVKSQIVKEKNIKTVAKLLSDNEKLIKANQVQHENIKTIQLRNQNLIAKYNELINMLDPNCSLGKCLKENEKNAKLKNENVDLKETIYSHYKTKAEMEGTQKRGPANINEKTQDVEAWQ